MCPFGGTIVFIQFISKKQMHLNATARRPLLYCQVILFQMYSLIFATTNAMLCKLAIRGTDAHDRVFFFHVIQSHLHS